jgi:exodeoxyribonuclease V alpha subunit
MQELVEGVNGKDDGVVGLLRPDVSGLDVQTAVKDVAGAGGGAGIRYENGKVYLASLYNYERFCAKKLQTMMANPRPPIYRDIEALRSELDSLGITNEFTLAPEQEEALMNAMNSRVAVITGGPGCGKSTITRALCQLMDAHNIRYRLCSPTGRAAKRLTECVGGTLVPTDENPDPNPNRMASTIHRLLEYHPQESGFLYNLNNPLVTDCVIADESSMIDIKLFYDLVSAMEDDDRLVLVGDANQLPSVGPGNVLRDIIASGVVPTVKLQRVFRQAQGSFITEVAHDILHGKVPHIPVPSQSKGKNCMFAGATEIEDLKDIILTLVSKVLPSKGFKPSDIQILTPMRERGLGINDLNPILQGAINPPAPHKTEFNAGIGRTFRVGDRVMQTRNNYDKNVFNGEQGEVVGIDRASDPVTLGVKFPDQDDAVIYEQSELDELLHAYAITVHRSQGSEFPVALVLVHPSHSVMLQRNLFYTGLTRAKKLCIVVGTDGAIKRAVDNATEQARNTTLAQLLRAGSQ